MTEPSKTPRTDAARLMRGTREGDVPTELVKADFARSLELALTAAEAALVQALKPKLYLRGHNEDGTPWMGTAEECMEDLRECAAAEAKGGDEARKALAEARAECEKLRLPASRYLWLRERDWHLGPLCVVKSPREAVRLGYDCPSRDRLDAAIDAAMRGESDVT